MSIVQSLGSTSKEEAQIRLFLLFFNSVEKSILRP